MKKSSVLVVILLCVQITGADTSFASVNSQGFIKITFDNDVFLKTDHYYTSGLDVDIYYQKFHFGILNLFALNLHRSTSKLYTLSIAQNIYTPEKTSSSEIVFNDRPYAGTLTSGLKEHAFFSNSKIETELEFGFIGNIAGSGVTQNIIHKVIGNDTISGWQNQINNDLVLNLNYSMTYLLFNSHLTDMTSTVYLRVGTLHTDFAGGLCLRVGKRTNKFGDLGPENSHYTNKRWQLYTFFSATPRFVLHNATLNGGIFNPTSRRYTLKYGEMENLVIEYQTGITWSINRFALQLTGTFLTKEFKTGKNHGWAGISIYYSF